VFQPQTLLSLTIYIAAAAAAAVDEILRVRVSLRLPFAVVFADGTLVSANIFLSCFPLVRNFLFDAPSPFSALI